MSGHTGLVARTAYRYGSIDQIDARMLYQLLRLRIQVFVVERQMPRMELDDIDVNDKTVHLWAERSGEVVAGLRLHEQDDGAFRVSRLCTALEARGQGLATKLMQHAITMAKRREVVVDAPIRTRGFFERLGFRQEGEKFVKDGMPHVELRL